MSKLICEFAQGPPRRPGALGRGERPQELVPHFSSQKGWLKSYHRFLPPQSLQKSFEFSGQGRDVRGPPSRVRAGPRPLPGNPRAQVQPQLRGEKTQFPENFRVKILYSNLKICSQTASSASSLGTPASAVSCPLWPGGKYKRGRRLHATTTTEESKARY